MTDTLERVVAFCSGRYNQLRDTQPAQARAYMHIINQAHELPMVSTDPERDLLDWLSKQRSDPELAKACKEVLERLGAQPQSS